MKRILAIAAAMLVTLPSPALAQRNIGRQIRENRDALDGIRQQRDRLQQALDALRGQVHDATAELENLDRQQSATNRLVNEFDRHISQLATQLDTINAELALTGDALAEKQAVLQRRLVDIYKRGSLWAFQVLLGAESFGDLLSRYKYLVLVGQQDRALVSDITTLRDRITAQRRDMLSARREVEVQRRERGAELRRYADLERERQRALSQMQESEQQTVARLMNLERDERRLNDLISTLERTRRSGVSTAPNVTSADIGLLDWPVDGDVIYRFGPQEFRDGTSIAYRGIGIGAPLGSAVHAVRSGAVVWAQSYGTYGPSVWIDHGGGYYTLYLHLSRVQVSPGDQVAAAQVIGLSGGANSEEGPHIEFQIRQIPNNASTPIPLDPLNWLRPRP
jgi:septal ring factor EnvC (AmiA/AmiB activator)